MARPSPRHHTRRPSTTSCWTRVTVLMRRRQKTAPDAGIGTKDLDKTKDNRTEGPNGQVIPAQCEGVVMVRLKSPPRVESGLTELSPEAHPPEPRGTRMLPIATGSSRKEPTWRNVSQSLWWPLPTLNNHKSETLP